MDAVRGGAGSDTLVGGSGSDLLRGDLGADVFAWSIGDEATTQGSTAAGSGNPYGVGNAVKVVGGATDVILDFNVSSTGSEVDKLDLRDLLQGESHTGTSAGNLADFLHFEKSGSGSSQATIVHVSTTGGFSNDAHAVGSNYSATSENQTIILKGVDLIGSNTTDQQIIQALLTNNKLIVD